MNEDSFNLIRGCVMIKLKEKLKKKIEARNEEVKAFLKEYGKEVISQVTVEQTFGGARGVKSLVCETSLLDPEEGIRFRGYTIPECREKLPKATKDGEPLPEGVFYLLLTGDIPTHEDIKEIQDEFKKRGQVPAYVIDQIRCTPVDTHPMTQFSLAILAMQRESLFAKAYREGVHRSKYWEYNLEDAFNLLAKLPAIAAYIYRRMYKGDTHIPADPSLDWAANFAHMLGYDNPEVYEMMRLYLFLHCDHESGNVSAHTAHCVASALSDVYYSLSAGIDGLAGPLHGLANQEVMRWVLDVKPKLGGAPTKEALEKFVWDTLNAGQVIPGYGHAVLRKTDPRYIAQREFAMKYMSDDENFQIVKLLYEVVPPILIKQGKAKDPWPNVDAHSGVLLYHYGITEFDFYTVFFGVSRAIGILSQIVWDRALNAPIERPKSETLESIKKLLKK